MADTSKLKYIPADNYSISLVLHNREMVYFPDYDGKTRSYVETKRELNELISCLTTNPFGKVKFTIRLGYDSESFMDRDMLFYIVDEVIRSHRTSNIRIRKEYANISFKA